MEIENVPTSCPICAEDFTTETQGKKLQCCTAAILCKNCLYSHIKSILEEGIAGDGRKRLSCPFGCGKEISDLTVRETFKLNHQRKRSRKKKKRFHMFKCGLRYLFPQFQLRTEVPTYESYISGKSPEELNDLRLYERWSLSIALSTSKEEQQTSNSGHENSDEEMDASRVYVHVMSCPQPDCECIWLVNKAYRTQKLELESSFSDGKRHAESPKGFTETLMLKFYSKVIFDPVSPKIEESMMNGNGYTTEHWINPGLRGGERLRRIAEDASSDGRMVSCPSCSHQFCGLCSRPWCAHSNTGELKTHTGRLCEYYGMKVPGDDDGFFHAMHAGDARLCPGCSMRTNRIDGCNHMTCPCGYEWCYVCECRWHIGHYGCIDRRGIGEGNSVGNNGLCIIS